MEKLNIVPQILLIDDDPESFLKQFIIDLEESLGIKIRIEQDFENSLKTIDSMNNDLRIIILDIMAPKYDQLFGKSTFRGFNSGLVLLEEIEMKLKQENRREKISIIMRSARQDLSQSDFQDDVKFFDKEEIDEIKDCIRKILFVKK